MWLLVGIALAAEPRLVTKSVEPAWTTPEQTIGCTALLDVGADGVPTVRKVKPCKRNLPEATAALSQWRFAPSGEVEEIELSHRAGVPEHVLERTEPVWASPAEEIAGRTCFAQVTVDPTGNLVGTDITDCDEPAACGSGEPGSRGCRR